MRGGGGKVFSCIVDMYVRDIYYRKYLNQKMGKQDKGITTGELLPNIQRE